MTQMSLSLSQKFTRESADTLAEMKATGTGHALDDVRVYFSQLKKYRQRQYERPAMLQPKTMRLTNGHGGKDSPPGTN
jgi:hypothetical protein